MVTYKIVQPHHLNPNENLFGGALMSWMDEICAMHAWTYTEKNCVTRKVGEIEFKKPAVCGDRIKLQTEVVREGRTSIGIKVRVSRTNFEVKDESIAEAEFFFVAIDSQGRKVQWHTGKTDADEE